MPKSKLVLESSLSEFTVVELAILFGAMNRAAERYWAAFVHPDTKHEDRPAYRVLYGEAISFAMYLLDAVYIVSDSISDPDAVTLKLEVDLRVNP